ncbi:MAG: hypothetical protein IPK22_06305 [Verrucomicrobiaceae bacterium]|nr:hypothetical protein [Verrucomicrobiaceae bacterium]
MSHRTWVCLSCQKSYRRVQTISNVSCALCGQACEYVHWKLHIPSPKKTREWKEFWTQYLHEKNLIAQFHADPTLKQIDLPLLNQRHSKQ